MYILHKHLQPPTLSLCITILVDNSDHLIVAAQSKLKFSVFSSLSQVCTLALLPRFIFVNMFCCCSALIPQDGMTALMEASSNRHSDTVSLLVSAGAQVDLQDVVCMCISTLKF